MGHTVCSLLRLAFFPAAQVSKEFSEWLDVAVVVRFSLLSSVLSRCSFIYKMKYT